MVRITEDVLKKMREMRKAGYTYREIRNALGVSEWACIRYLRDIEVTRSAVGKAWKEAEKKAIKFLQEKGFEEIHDLNKISPSPYWDILAKKDGKWWLIDVTISEGKKLGAKIPYFVDGYIHAILYRYLNNGGWKLVALSVKEI